VTIRECVSSGIENIGVQDYQWSKMLGIARKVDNLKFGVIGYFGIL